MTTPTATSELELGPPTTVIVPGLRGEMADHWQTLLAGKLDRVATVAPLEHDKLSLAARVAALDAVLSDIAGPVVLVAHSMGVLITVHWAVHATRTVRGALLAAPPDIETPAPTGTITVEELDHHGWLPIPRRPLPFPSIVAASTNDPLATSEWAAGMAHNWGSRLVDIGAVGHLSPADGYGPWPPAEHLIEPWRAAGTAETTG